MRAARMAAAWVGALAGACVTLLFASPAHGTATTVAPGGTYTLTANVMMTGADTFTAGAFSGARCTIHGGGFTIATDASWTGTLSIINCDIDDLGSATAASIDAAGSGAITIQSNTFTVAGAMAYMLSGAMSITFTDNKVTDDSVVPVETALSDSVPFFYATGTSTGAKLFQGNRIMRSFLKFEATGGWSILANVLIGLRAGIYLSGVSDMTVQGNYTHTFVGASAAVVGWNQVKDFTITGGNNVTVEHNVFREGAWLTEPDNAPIELRYNLLIAPWEHAWIQVRSTAGAKIHHNLLIALRDRQFPPQGGITMISDGTTDTPTTEIYNNTLDAGGVCDMGIGGAIAMDSGVGSIRSNAFVGVRFAVAAGPAMIGFRSAGGVVPNPLPPSLGYTDYNLFYNLDQPGQVHYGAGVAGKTEHVDPGFALHDVPSGSSKDEDVDPKFAGDPNFQNKIPRVFPYNDDDITSGTTTVCQILAYYRKIYAPGAGSPMIDAGDPQEGAGNDVGAIGAGATNSLDLFGTLCDPSDVGNPTLTADSFTCASVTPTGGSGGGGGATGNGGTGPGEVPHGFTCVCDVSAAAPTSTVALEGALGVVSALLALAQRRRRRNRRARTAIR